MEENRRLGYSNQQYKKESTYAFKSLDTYIRNKFQAQ